MTNQILKYPFDRSAKNRTWIRFKQLDFELDENNVTKIKGANTDVVYLYLPGGIQFEDNINYGDKNLSFAGSAIERAIQAGAFGPIKGQNIGKVTGAALDFGGSAFKDVIQLGGDIINGKKINAGLITKVLEKTKFDNTSFGAGIKSGLRYTANPHKRSLFQGVGLRGFSFEFNMVPRNKQEAEEIKKIIKFFRLIAYPSNDAYVPNPEVELNQDSDSIKYLNSLNYKFPSMLKVDMFYQLGDETIDILNTNPVVEQELQNQLGPDVLDNGMIRIGPRLQYCHIDKVAGNLDPDNTMAWHGDGNPVATTLSLSITEDRTLTKSSIMAGY